MNEILRRKDSLNHMVPQRLRKSILDFLIDFLKTRKLSKTP